MGVETWLEFGVSAREEGFKQKKSLRNVRKILLDSLVEHQAALMWMRPQRPGRTGPQTQPLLRGGSPQFRESLLRLDRDSLERSPRRELGRSWLLWGHLGLF